jgi:hypothetical protein
MKKNLGTLISVAALCVAVPTPAAAQAAAPTQTPDANELAEARAIIEIMFPPSQRQQMIKKMMEDILAPMRASLPKGALDEPGLKAIMDEHLTKMQARSLKLFQKHMPALFEAMVTAYTREFSLAELKEVHAFARSPAGTHYLSKSTAMVGDPAMVQVNTAMFADSRVLSQEMLPKLKQDIMDYLIAHPELAQKLAAERSAQ